MTGQRGEDYSMDQLSIDCIAQHLKIFHEQAAFDRTADFGEPCGSCPHVMKECRMDWLTRMKPLFDRTDIQIRLGYPELPDTKGNPDIYVEFREGKLEVKDS